MTGETDRDDCAPLKLLLAQSTLALVRSDAAGRFVSWSPRLAEIFGHAESEVVGRSPAELGVG